MLDDTVLRVKVEGDFACFTRPDLKVERMSYPCMTYSAARGVLDSILWKPEFKWYIRRILVLKPVQYASIKRNEINSKQGITPIIIDELRPDGKPKFRSQRNSIVLKDVAYIIEASVFQDKFDEKNPPKKYAEMFTRRVRKGQCYRRPYLGTREFSCEFYEPSESDKPIADDIPIGSIFFDIFYDENGGLEPVFAYDAAIRNGVFECDKDSCDRLMKSSHIRPDNDDGVKNILQFYARTEEEEYA